MADTPAETEWFWQLMAQALTGSLEDVLAFLARNRGELAGPATGDSVKIRQFALSAEAYGEWLRGQPLSCENLKPADGGEHRVSLLDTLVARRFALADVEHLLTEGFLPGGGMKDALAALHEDIDRAPTGERHKRAEHLNCDAFAARTELQVEAANKRRKLRSAATLRHFYAQP